MCSEILIIRCHVINTDVYMQYALLITEVAHMGPEVVGPAGVEWEAVVGQAGATATPLPLLTAEQPRSMLLALKEKTKMKFWLILP